MDNYPENSTAEPLSITITLEKLKKMRVDRLN